jgi:hypothetical protein
LMQCAVMPTPCSSSIFFVRWRTSIKKVVNQRQFPMTAHTQKVFNQKQYKGLMPDWQSDVLDRVKIPGRSHNSLTKYTMEYLRINWSILARHWKPTNWPSGLFFISPTSLRSYTVIHSNLLVLYPMG